MLLEDFHIKRYSSLKSDNSDDLNADDNAGQTPNQDEYQKWNIISIIIIISSSRIYIWI